MTWVLLAGVGASVLVLLLVFVHGASTREKCAVCDGSGRIEVEIPESQLGGRDRGYQLAFGGKFYRKEKCPVCSGTGLLGD